MNTSKHSRQRDAILEVLKGTKVHPTADWVYSEVRKIIPNISLGTVYRNLSKLSDEKAIVKLGLGTSVEHFDGNPDPHYHVMCTECGAIKDIETEPLEEFNEWAKKLFNGEIYKHSAIFFGRCNECQN
ncbi:MAG: transcriptional repressor [Ruminococcaceae bacterium]|nr:transcriptional repressor [Oscillospiraceae bacterium]